MSAIMNGLGTILGYVMYFCYHVLGNYALAILLFTLLTKVILLPVAIWVQNNGIKMPKLGYGDYQTPPQDTRRCVLDAIEVGYRSIDTAQAYFNEEGVGEALKKSGLPREEYLKMAAKIPGVYVPSLYDVAYKPDGTIEYVRP